MRISVEYSDNTFLFFVFVGFGIDWTDLTVELLVSVLPLLTIWISSSDRYSSKRVHNLCRLKKR